MSKTFSCPFCKTDRLTYVHREGSAAKVRCQTCGYPVEEGPVEVEKLILGRPKILCIDDDRLLLRLFADLLERQNFEILTAFDGPLGVAMAKKEHPDLILLDVMMPETDGFEICRRLRADPGLTHTPIIILTAMPDPRVNIRGLEAGATMSIRKPFNLDRLIATIKTALALVAKTSAP